jgi:hypothetical protein
LAITWSKEATKNKDVREQAAERRTWNDEYEIVHQETKELLSQGLAPAAPTFPQLKHRTGMIILSNKRQWVEVDHCEAMRQTRRQQDLVKSDDGKIRWRIVRRAIPHITVVLNSYTSICTYIEFRDQGYLLRAYSS